MFGFRTPDFDQFLSKAKQILKLKNYKIMRQQYKRSICSTCHFLFLCSLTKDKSMIHSCSEYEHYLEHQQEKFKSEEPIMQFNRRRIRGKSQLFLK
ncbi:MAG TPA: hypothetical protein DIT95_04245 [Arenibacter sp.]|nr:hypothetical protein [Arenibacter sp.]